MRVGGKLTLYVLYHATPHSHERQDPRSTNSVGDNLKEMRVSLFYCLLVKTDITDQLITAQP